MIEVKVSELEDCSIQASNTEQHIKNNLKA